MSNNINIDSTIGEIVKENYSAADVFKKYNIDYCCGGNKTIAKACADNELIAEKLIEELEQVNTKSVGEEKNYKDWPLDFLTNYIINVHHKYVKANVPLLLEYTNKIATQHGARHPELHKVKEYFHKVAEELKLHMMKEENILFPFIIKLQEAEQNKLKIDRPPFGTIANPIRMMEAEHEDAGNLLTEMRNITNNYTLPEDACNTYSVTFKKLDEFENDLHLHIHLENNILFPKSIELEYKFFEII